MRMKWIKTYETLNEPKWREVEYTEWRKHKDSFGPGIWNEDELKDIKAFAKDLKYNKPSNNIVYFTLDSDGESIELNKPSLIKKKTNSLSFTIRIGINLDIDKLSDDWFVVYCYGELIPSGYFYIADEYEALKDLLHKEFLNNK